ncbi:hypothetical protein N9545_07215 [Salibacteraceae bacterium]|jgi:hypothetical protein|nr:hypothetical protein [Salibacteraceae bacterium]MDB9708953.1 hypothetical protein [Salibacteraceae bacterium]HAQ71949.1 hypothetical protein [Flavobacteriales bacterium]
MRLLLFISFILSQAIGFSQERSLTISTSKESILIGDQMEMNVVLRGASGDTMLLPLIEDTLITEIEILSRSKVDTAFEGAQLEYRILSQTYTITSFDSGYFPISPRVALINGEEVESNPFLIAVQTIEVDTSKGIVDIKDIEQVPFSVKEWLQENWQWIAIGIFLIALITIIALKLSKRKPKVEPEIIIPERPANEIAAERLEQLKEEKLWQAGKIKLYYSELSDILREYIEHRYLIPALEQTTDEIINGLRHNPDLSPELVGKVRQLLFLSDLVKFAKENPVGNENEMNFSIAESFVKETTPIPLEKNKEKEDDV